MSQTEVPAVQLREYLAVLRRRRWTILAVAGLVVASALVFSLRSGSPAQAAPLHRAQVRVLVNPLPPGLAETPSPVNLETQRQVIASELVASRVVEEEGLGVLVDEFLNNLTVEAVAGSEVLVISYQSDDRDVARRAASATAQTYIAERAEQAAELLRLAETSTERQLATRRLELRRLDRRLARAPNRAVARSLQAQRAEVFTRLESLRDQLRSLASQRQLFEPAEILGESVTTTGAAPAASPNRRRNVALAAVIGLLMGVGVAFLQDNIDDRLRDPASAERDLGVPVLAAVPKRNAVGGPPRSALAAVLPSGVGEAYRNLRANLQLLAERDGFKSVVVTSPSYGEDRATAAVNLAQAFARSGYHVIAVSADLSQPRFDRFFDVGTRPGLRDWLMRAEQDPRSLLTDVGIANLRVLTSGSQEPTGPDLLSSPRLASLVNGLSQLADIVVFDAPPVLPVADSRILAAHAGATVLVLNARSTTGPEAVQAKDELRRAGARVVGVVLDEVDPAETPYGERAGVSTRIAAARRSR